MKILLTGANGYIGSRLLPRLLEQRHHVTALVRSPARFDAPKSVERLKGDLLDPPGFPTDLDAAYYLVHSMSDSAKSFQEIEEQCAVNFVRRIEKTSAKQVIYLTGFSSAQKLSRHLASRKRVGEILRQGKVPVTALQAGIIIGSGSASFEIIRDLVEKLPVMVAPKWVKNRTQPISIANALDYLTAVLGNSKCIGRSFDIGGPDVLTYKDLLLGFARIRGLRRWIITVPVLTPRLSSYWLYFVTSANFSLARSLVESLESDSVCQENSICEIVSLKLMTYEEAVRRAFEKIEQGIIPSGWKDAIVESSLDPDLSRYIQVPTFGCFIDKREAKIKGDPKRVQERIWALGGENGWPACNWAWGLRGFMDKLFGGVGLRRGRTHPTRLRPGDALDFWRVVLADEEKGRLLLYAEMKLPGEAWLEFRIEEGSLLQTATFRPKGIWGRLYWILLYPIHVYIFRKMCRVLAGV